MNVDYKLIGLRIKEERKKSGLSQEKLAEKLNVSIGYISQVERGITKISLDLLGAISSILNCNISSLIDEAAVCSYHYLENELMLEFEKLDTQQRKLVLDFIKLLNEHR